MFHFIALPLSRLTRLQSDWMQNVIRLCCLLWEQQMAYLDQITCAPYLKCRIHSERSDVSRKLLVRTVNVARYSRAYLKVNTHFYCKLVKSSWREKCCCVHCAHLIYCIFTADGVICLGLAI